ncbi:MAG: outer membrane beta-barrel protein [Proteobacteria bacterium]|nr:outer membrane beta-barrel protein [Pseudomonadota bacterium]
MANSDVKPFSGYYVNLSIGALQNAPTIDAFGSASFFRLNTGPGNQLNSSQEERVWKNSFISALSFGYGSFIINDWHLSGEIFANWSNHRKATLDNLAQSRGPLDSEFLLTETEVKLHNLEFGLDLLPGFFFDTQSLVYGRIGLAINELALNSESLFAFTDFAINPGATDNSTVTMSSTPNKIALRLGLGVEHQICYKLSVTADYIYTYYGHAKAHEIADVIALPEVPIAHVINGLYGNASAKLQTQMLMLGVKYYLDV